VERAVAGDADALAYPRSVSAKRVLFPTGIDLPPAWTGFVPTNGGTRIDQVCCRNSAAFCTAATFNLTNGVRVEWSR
jgi:hypothetical protein